MELKHYSNITNEITLMNNVITCLSDSYSASRRELYQLFQAAWISLPAATKSLVRVIFQITCYSGSPDWLVHYTFSGPANISFTGHSLRKKFFRSQAQRAGNRQILGARKNYRSPNIFCQSMGGLTILIWLICQKRLLQWHRFVALIKRICISAPVYF